jgi:photosystem II stability/assembly factor-like uncharacterized protein
MKRKLTMILSMFFAAASFLFFNGKIEKALTMDDYIQWKIEQSGNKKPTNGFPDKAMQWYIDQRTYPLGYIPEHWKEEAVKHIAANNIEGLLKTNAALNWTQAGPGNIGGRIRSVAVHPTDVNIVYIGSVGGGVWKTLDGGSNWTPLKDNMENLAVCALVIDPVNPAIIYAGTGEGFFNSDAIRGEGIFKSVDGGTSWSRLASTNNENFYYVNKLLIDNSTNVLWAATRKGLFFSVDGGNSFNSKLAGSGGSDIHCTDVEVAYTSPSTIFASIGLFNQSQIWRSTDGGNNFFVNYEQTGKGRIELAASVSEPSKVYASFMDLSTNGVSLISYTNNSGGNWQAATVPGPSYSGASNYAGTQGWYDNILAVDPANSNIVFAGGVDLWKSTNGGTNWVQKTNWYEEPGAPQYVHADFHSIIYSPSNANVMYVGNDGGIYRSDNRGDSWSARNNNLFITQFYYGAVAPTGNKFYGGTQDNGTLASNGSSNWITMMGGDGGATEVDFNNPNTIYMEYVNLAFFKSTDGGASYIKKMNGIPTGPDFWSGTTDRTLFISPFSMDPNNSNTIVAGTYRIWRTVNGADNWSAISGDLTGDGTSKISTVVIAKGNSNVIYAGCTNGRIQVTTNGGTNWNLKNTGLPNAYCTRISIDPNNSATAYATYSGFLAGNHVYKTINYGDTWVNVTGNLPNIPVNCVFVNPSDANNVFIGTDLGVFSTETGGNTWVQNNNGLANVSVHDLDYRVSDNMLFAATHGRSFYHAELSGGSGGQTATLIYDDGSPTSGYYWQSLGDGSANRITPTLPNAKLVSMSIYFTAVNAGIASYTPIVLQDNGGSPGANHATVPVKVALAIPGWDDIDLSGYNITVNNDFYIGLLYDGVNRPAYGYDPVDNGRAWDKAGGNWSSWNETYFMRATISTVTSVVEIDTKIPETFEVSSNFPNPFNPSTKFKYALPEGRNVSIIIYDIRGRKITELVNNFQSAGTYEVTWNGKNDDGNVVASGTYIYSIKAGDFSVSKKMIMMK